MKYDTSELCDIYQEDVNVVEPLFSNFGGRSSFGGQIITVKCFEDNGLLYDLLEQNGRGRVLLVDGGGSVRRALVDAELARLATQNEWEGVTAINLTSAKSFGECEYWLSAIKVFAIVLFICAGGVMIYSLMGHSDWHPTLKTDGMWFPHGWEQIVVYMTIVIYSFQGVELVGNAAGETESPHIILPKVILGIGLRIILFYGLAIAVLALVYPHELTPNGQSPFVWVFSHAGIPGADTLMTLVIFSAAVSAANSAIYASSRMLWSMAGDRFAPACFGKTNGGGVPVYAILITALLALVSLLTRYIPAQQFYLYLIASTGQVGCLAWITIGWCQYRFRQSVRNGTYASDLLRYRSPLFPWTARFVIITNFAIMVGTWFSEQGVVIMLVELAFMIGILLSWYLFRPTLSRLRNTVG